MPTIRARIKRRHQAHGFEILVLVLAILAGLSYFSPHGGLPLTIWTLSHYLAYLWGGLWIAGGLLTLVGVLSGNAKMEVPGLILFLSCIVVYVPVLMLVGGSSAYSAAVISAYAGVVIYNRIMATVSEGRQINHGY